MTNEEYRVWRDTIQTNTSGRIKSLIRTYSSGVLAVEVRFRDSTPRLFLHADVPQQRWQPPADLVPDELTRLKIQALL